MDGQDSGDSEKLPSKGGLDGLNLDIDKPMEELLILLGASRLHTDKDGLGKTRKRNRERDKSNGEALHRPSTATSSSSQGTPGSSHSSPSCFGSPMDDSRLFSGYPGLDTLPTFADPTLFGMFSDENEMRMPGDMADEAESAWRTFVSEMETLNSDAWQGIYYSDPANEQQFYNSTA